MKNPLQGYYSLHRYFTSPFHNILISLYREMHQNYFPHTIISMTLVIFSSYPFASNAVKQQT